MPKFSLKTLSRALRIVAWLSLLFSVLALAQLLFEEDIPIGLPTTDDGKMWTGNVDQLLFRDRFLLFLVVGFPSFLWIFALTRILTIAKRVSRGEVLVTANCYSLTHFSIALLLFGISNCFSDLLAGLVLEARDYVQNVEYADLFDVASVADLSAAAILLWLIAQILLHAVALREENELTI